MSKKHNSKTPRPAAEPVVEIEETVELAPENDEPVVESTPVEEPVVALRGVVTDCTKLNVRVAPVMGATVVCEITRGTKVDVYQDKSTDEWFSVCTESGVEGFCMKKYISI
jgi:uncharacterized protein YgiM (DUF1202 family)